MYRGSSVAGLLALTVLTLTSCGGGSSTDTSGSSSEATADPDAVLSCLTDGGLDAKLKTFSSPDPQVAIGDIRIKPDDADSIIEVALYTTSDAAEVSVNAQNQAAGDFDYVASRYGPTTVVTVYGPDDATTELAVVDTCV